MANKFLAELQAALENHEPTEEILKDAPEVGNTELESQKKAVDTDGNPEAPGDPEATPAGGKEEDPKVSELPAEKDSSLPNADDVPAPGDENGNPAPATEAFGSPSGESMKKVNGMSHTEIIKIAVPFYCMKKGIAINADRTMDEYANGEPDPDGDDDDFYYDKIHFRLTKTSAGPVIECIKSYNMDRTHADDRKNSSTLADVGSVKFCKIKKNGKSQRFMVTYLSAEKLAKFAAAKLDYDANAAKDAAKREAKMEKAQPASESLEVGKDTLNDFPQERDLHKNRNLIPLQQEKDAQDASGNTGDPAENKQTPVSPSGEPKEATLDKAVQDSYDESGHTETPGVNGTPVSKSGDSKPLPKNEFEKAADDKDGNPEAPGVPGDPAPSFESFIAACEQLVTEVKPGSVIVPETMSLESYAYELGMGEIASRAVEADLTAAERRALKDSDFGLPDQRKWPLNDANHVRSAIQHFHWCPKENQRELAKNILKAMRKFGMKDVEVSEGNPFIAYYPEAKVVARKKPEKKAQ